MAKTKYGRLNRLEYKVSAEAGTGTTTLRPINDKTKLLMTTIAATQTFNLPPATGKGGRYRFFIGITATGNKVFQAAGADLIQGVANMAPSGGSGDSFGTATTTTAITLNGTTTGGIIGTMLELHDAAKGVWATVVNAVASGTVATPFNS